MILVLDTETTGKVDFRMPPAHESQPNLVQIGLILADDNLTERASFCAIAQPKDFEIPKEASEIHGITTEMAIQYGLSLRLILAMFDRFARNATTIIGHSLDFDLTVIETAWLRTENISKLIIPLQRICTMRTATAICKIPHENPRKPDDWKWPKLEECMKHFFNEDFSGHNALVDARACLRVFGALREVGAIP